MKQLLLIILLAFGTLANAQSFQDKVSKWAKEYTRTDCNIKPSSLKTCTINNEEKSIRLVFAGGFQEQHFTPNVIEYIYKEIEELLPNDKSGYEITVETEEHAIEDLVPNSLRKKKKDSSRMLKEKYEGTPWVTNMSRPYTAKDGLYGNHISLWQSHGRYLKSTDNDWYWQRPRLFCTTEDLFSQTFVIPYIIPMLENAGAVVFTPRERDWQSNEVIVDNDHPSKNGTYIETSRKKQKKVKWQNTGRDGFANYKEIYECVDTPFCAGTARYAKAVSSASEEVVAHWMPSIPEEGRYAVYVSYQSFDNSVEDAMYKVYHKGGITEFRVNQKIGGGTWLYLGTFDFDKGEHDYGMVTLCNRSNDRGIVTADAVRFGGGMGNVVPSSYSSPIPASGLPRWAEAAKYSTFWYGFPYSVHTQTFGRDDYKNDINARSQAVNYLSGGSIYNPNRKGMRVPLDLNIAFHTDAGFSATDEYVGSLSIYRTDFNEGKTGAGLDRYVSRDLASSILTNLTVDLKKYNWQVRQLWNRDYGEAREPMSPCCILEMLSHQNFADMRLGYDPHFKFDFSRSVYKSIVKFLATIYDRDYAIQPLPVTHFAIDLNDKKKTVTLSWQTQDDPLEPSAKATSYIVYTRRGNQSFDNGTIVKGTSYTMELMPNVVYSFKVAAVNNGGESFPSEVLSAGVSNKNTGTVLIVNGFTRLEGPAVINTSTEAGFDLDTDPGVPYGAFAGYCGKQTGWQRSKAGIETSGGLGASGNEYEGTVMMGNTFDYAATHGEAILSTGKHSFTSCSEEALLSGKMAISDYPISDIIYGVQKQFNQRTNSIIENYAKAGGKLIISAANNGAPAIGGIVSGTIKEKKMKSVTGCGLTFDIYREMNPQSYCVPSPSSLIPNTSAIAIMTYQNGDFAAIAEQGKYVRLGFPLEAITEGNKINKLMNAFLKFIE